MGPAPIDILQKIPTSLPNIPTFFVICHFHSFPININHRRKKNPNSNRPCKRGAPRLPLQKLRHMKQLGAISDLRSGRWIDPLELGWLVGSCRTCRFAVRIHSGLRECSKLEKKNCFGGGKTIRKAWVWRILLSKCIFTLVFAETKFLSVKLYSFSSGCGSTVRHIPQTRT